MHRLYVFVRTDLPSMTPGKAMAHSGHAANAAVFYTNKSAYHTHVIHEWEGQIGFGTQINLFAPWPEVEQFLESLTVLDAHGVVIDPTYPYEAPSEFVPFLQHSSEPIDRGDGKHLCFRTEKTAAWIFVEDNKVKLLEKLKKFPLA